MAWWPGSREKAQTGSTGRGQGKTDPLRHNPLLTSSTLPPPLTLHHAATMPHIINLSGGDPLVTQNVRTPLPLAMPHSTPKSVLSLVFINLIRLTVKIIPGHTACSVSKTNQAKVLSKRDKLMYTTVTVLMEGVCCLKMKVESIL